MMADTAALSTDGDWATREYLDLDFERAHTVVGGSTLDAAEAFRRKRYDEDEYLTKGEYLTKAQAGEIVQLNPKTIERHILSGKIKAYKLAGKIRIRRDDLQAWVEANEVAPSVQDI